MRERLEKIRALEVIEARKELFKDIKKDMSSHYLKDGYIAPKIITGDYKTHSDEKSVKVDKDLFKEYLTKEIEALDKKATELIDELKELI